MEWLTPALPWIGGAIALISTAAALRAHRKQRLIEDLPTSKTLGVFIGLVELKGTAESEKPLRSYLAEAACVHYEWKVQEHYSRTTTEEYTDSNGKTQTRTKTESGWTTVEEGGNSQPFYLKDSQGAVLVRPAGAELEPQTIFSPTCTPNDTLYYLKGPPGSVADSTHERRFTERAFRLHAPIFVVGKARERSDVVAPEIAKDEGAEMFLISSRTEDSVAGGFWVATWLLTALGLVLLLGSLALWDHLNLRDPAARLRFYASAALAFGVVWLMGWVGTVFNSLISLRNRVSEAWALVDVQLKRRHDLIPNLVRIVNALKDHERRVQNELGALRGQLNATPPGKAGEDYRALKPAVVALQESYPVLKTYDAFQNLQRHLIETENRIALARDYYNTIVTHCNTRLKTMPDGFVATLTATRPRPLLRAPDFERAPVPVDFAR